jgi:hypothetical protein
MGSPIATKKSGFLCFAFPDICKTPVGPAIVPIPYPNIGDLGDATDTSTNVFAGGDPVIHKGSQIEKTMGDEAGTIGGVKSGSAPKGKVEFTSASGSVFVNGQPVVRMFDSTKQNKENAVGRVLMGFPTVFVGD